MKFVERRTSSLLNDKTFRLMSSSLFSELHCRYFDSKEEGERTSKGDKGLPDQIYPNLPLEIDEF